MGDHLKLKNGALLFCCTCCECPECYERKGTNCECELKECSECQTRGEDGCCVDPECGPCQHIEDGCCVDNEEPCCGVGETLNSEGQCVPYAGQTCQSLGFPAGYTFNSNYVCVPAGDQTCQDLGFPEGYDFYNGYCTEGGNPPTLPCGPCRYLGSYIPSSVRIDFIVEPPPEQCTQWYCVPALCGVIAPDPIRYGEAWTGYTIVNTNGKCSASDGPLYENGYYVGNTSIGAKVVACDENCGFKLFISYFAVGMANGGPCIQFNSLVNFYAEQDVCSTELGTFSFSGVWSAQIYDEDLPYPIVMQDITSNVTMTIS